MKFSRSPDSPMISSFSILKSLRLEICATRLDESSHRASENPWTRQGKTTARPRSDVRPFTIVYAFVSTLIHHSADLKLTTGKKVSSTRRSNIVNVPIKLQIQFSLLGTPEGDEIKDPSRPRPPSFVHLLATKPIPLQNWKTLQMSSTISTKTLRNTLQR